VRGLTFAVWAVAAASAVYWGLRLAARPTAAVAPVAGARSAVVPDPAAVARLLGSVPTPAALGMPATVASLASRFNLVGVVARPSRSGIALISVDGKPAKPFRVGSAVEEGLVLQAVEGRRALLGPGRNGPPAVTLELPPQRK